MLRRRNRPTVFSHLLLMQLVSVAVSLFVAGALFAYLLHSHYHGVREWELVERGTRMVRLLQEDLAENDHVAAMRRMHTLAESAGVGLWLVDAQGHVIGGSTVWHEFPLPTLDPGELRYVLEGNTLTKKVTGPEYQNLLVVLPILKPMEQSDSYQVSGALAMRSSLGDIGATVSNVLRLMALAGLMAGAVVLAVSMVMAKGFARPLEKLESATLDIAKGRFRQLDLPSHCSEIDHLLAAFNYASQEIEKAIAKQQKLEQLRQRFLSDLAHELRAPLTSLKGFVELMNDSELPPEKLADYRAIMLADTEYIERLVADVSALARLDSGELSLEMEWIALNELLRQCLTMLQGSLEKKAMAIELDIAEELDQVYVDPKRLQQAVINLLSNALHFAPSGTTVTLRAYPTDRQWVLETADEGPGIADQDLPHIWDRFYKADPARTRRGRENQGSGLGLAIVKQIVEAHKGSVDVKSTLGEGSTFILRFPLPSDSKHSGR